MGAAMFGVMRLSLEQAILAIGEPKARALYAMPGSTPEDFYKACGSLAISPGAVLGSLWDALPSFMTLTRATTGTRFDSAGDFDTSGIDVARFTHDPYTGKRRGLLVEPQRTSYLDTSTPDAFWNAFNATLDPATVSVVQGKETLGATATLTNVSSGNSGINTGYFVPGGSVQTASIFVKGIGSSIGKVGVALFADFSFGSFATVVPVTLTEESQEIELVGNAPGTGGYSLLGFGNYNAYTGPVSNLENGDQYGLDLFNIQIGTGKTSPIESTVGPVTRDADVVTFTDTSRDIEVTYIPVGSSIAVVTTVAAGNQPVGLYGEWLRARQL